MLKTRPLLKDVYFLTGRLSDLLVRGPTATDLLLALRAIQEPHTFGNADGTPSCGPGSFFRNHQTRGPRPSSQQASAKHYLCCHWQDLSHHFPFLDMDILQRGVGPPIDREGTLEKPQVQCIWIVFISSKVMILWFIVDDD